MTRKVATVFGGSGFLGRYVVKRLAQADYVVRVAVRDTEGALFLRPMGAVGQIVPLRATITDETAATRAVSGAELVINLVGILAERKPGDFDRVHAEGAGRVARLAAAAGVSRMVHVSAIGADPASPGHYGRSKGEGERLVRAAFPHAAILRPSVVFGPEDGFLNRFAGMAQNLPVMPVVSPDSKFQPVFVGDVAEAIMKAAEVPGGGLFELGGPRVWTMRELIAWLLQTIQRHRPMVVVPPRILEVQARILERLPGKLLTRDQLIMLGLDNVAHPDVPGLRALAIEPTPVELVAPRYLARFRPGGGKLEMTDGPVRP